MKLELKEHEIEQAIETFIRSFVTGYPVTVKGFDLQGMRSKDGLSAIVDFDVIGVSDTREVKVDSPNVKPTNTAWREERKDEQDCLVAVEKPEAYYEVLTLLSSNPLNKNRKAIEELLDGNFEVKELLTQVALYQDWLAQCVKEDALVSEISPLDAEEKAMEALDEEPTEEVPFESDSEETVGDDEPHPALVASIAPEAEEDAIVLAEPTTSILDEVTASEEVQQTNDKVVTQPLFGTPLNKPNRKLFG